MRYGLRRLAGIAIASLTLSACGGGSGVPTLLPSSVSSPYTQPTQSPTASSSAVPQATSTQANVVLTIGGDTDTALAAIARHTASTGTRKPMYVSPSTLGITVSVSPGGSTQAFDVSSGSPLCTSGSPRTCTLSIVAPPGSDTFTLIEYDQAPSGGVIPGGAKQLATATLTQTITANANNTLNFYVDGIVTGVATSGGVTYGSLPADGAAHTYAISLIATDGDGNTVSAGSSTPYNNPITVTLTESGGSGHSYLVLNGTNVGTSATVSHSTDALSIHYDGGGSPGYSTSTAFSASGATGTSLVVSPMYLSGSFSFTDAGQNKTGSITEASAPANVAYSTSWTCSGFTKSVTGSGGSGTLSITSPPATTGSMLNSSYSCSNAVVSDNYGASISVPVSATIPTAATCSNQSANIYLGVKNGSNQYEVGSGSPCTLSFSGTAVTVYTPSDGSHPASATVTISEANDTNAITLSGCGSTSNATYSPTSIAGAGSDTGTASGTVTITAGTANTSCNITVSDGHGQSQNIAVTVDPGTVTSSGSGTYSWTSSSSCSVNPAAPPLPPFDTTDCDIWGPTIYAFNATVAPTTTATQLTVTVNSDSGTSDTGKCNGVATGTATTISLDNPSGTSVGNWTSTPGGITFTYYNASAASGNYYILLKDPCSSGTFSGNFTVTFSQTP
jgi:hypothetical protein